MRPSASIRSGIPEAIARTSGVTSSPVVPSPRVIARASRPPSYTTASESPSSFGITTTGWPGKRAKNSATCSGVFDFWSESIGAAVAHRRVQHGRRADLLERVRVGRELGMLGQQRAQLVLERVEVGVGDERLAAVVGVAQLGQPGGELLDPRLGVGTHPWNATRTR